MPKDKILNIANVKGKYDDDYSYLSDDMYIKYGKDWDMIASKNEFIEYQQKINAIRHEIYSKSLSPLERLMYAYDFVKSKTYKMSNDDSKNGLPHLTISGDSIVCRGYCLLLNEILYGDEEIKISDIEFDLYKEGKLIDRHDRNILVIKDDKYDLHGAYILDPTYDSYREEKKERYGTDYTKTDLYLFFLRKLTDKDIYHDNYEYNIFQLETDDNLNIHTTYVENQENRLKELFTSYPKEELSYMLEETFNNVFEGMDIETIRNYVLSAKTLDYETMMKLALNVRKSKGFSEDELKKEYERIARINAPYFSDAKDLNIPL